MLLRVNLVSFNRHHNKMSSTRNFKSKLYSTQNMLSDNNSYNNLITNSLYPDQGLQCLKGLKKQSKGL